MAKLSRTVFFLLIFVSASLSQSPRAPLDKLMALSFTESWREDSSNIAHLYDALTRSGYLLARPTISIDSFTIYLSWTHFSGGEFHDDFKGSDFVVFYVTAKDYSGSPPQFCPLEPYASSPVQDDALNVLGRVQGITNSLYRGRVARLDTIQQFTSRVYDLDPKAGVTNSFSVSISDRGLNRLISVPDFDSRHELVPLRISRPFSAFLFLPDRSQIDSGNKQFGTRGLPPPILDSSIVISPRAVTELYAQSVRIDSSDVAVYNGDSKLPLMFTTNNDSSRQTLFVHHDPLEKRVVRRYDSTVSPALSGITYDSVFVKSTFPQDTLIDVGGRGLEPDKGSVLKYLLLAIPPALKWLIGG